MMTPKIIDRGRFFLGSEISSMTSLRLLNPAYGHKPWTTRIQFYRRFYDKLMN